MLAVLVTDVTGFELKGFAAAALWVGTRVGAGTGAGTLRVTAGGLPVTVHTPL